VNDEFDTMWKDIFVSCFRVMSRHVILETEENKILPDRDLNLRILKYETGMQTSRALRLVY
jgi:hypothetical protein